MIALMAERWFDIVAGFSPFICEFNNSRTLRNNNAAKWECHTGPVIMVKIPGTWDYNKQLY